MKHLSITVHGKVQNVGFRYFTNKRAHEFNIKGFVKNQHDGTVYIEAEGEDRILVFAVTTTTSPTLCKVHPLGIIHI